MNSAISKNVRLKYLSFSLSGVTIWVCGKDQFIFFRFATSEKCEGFSWIHVLLEQFWPRLQYEAKLIFIFPRTKRIVTRFISGLSDTFSTLYTLHCTLYTVHSTLYTVHSTLYTLHSTLYTLHSTLYTLHSTLYTLHSTLYTLHFTLYNLHYTLHSTRYTVEELSFKKN